MIPVSIIGKWNIHSDSTYSGVGFTNHLVIYSGQPGDYFNFNNRGYVYTKENSILDTLRYSMSSDSIMIPDFRSGGTGEGLIPSFATHALVIRSGFFLTPGGIFGRHVYLTR